MTFTSKLIGCGIFLLLSGCAIGKIKKFNECSPEYSWSYAIEIKDCCDNEDDCFLIKREDIEPSWGKSGHGPIYAYCLRTKSIKKRLFVISPNESVNDVAESIFCKQQ
mgnify:CR=1 FL=1